jgi:hypothetical protein
MKRLYVSILLLLIPSFAFAWSDEAIANAIYKAEGGNKAQHPYGIMIKYKITTPRQACLNTIKHQRKKFAKQNKEKDFINFLGNVYCPTTGKLRPAEQRLNKNWVHNVKYFLQKG